MSFKITIEETTVEDVWIGREWKEKANGEKGYDYTPNVQDRRKVTREVLTQQVNTLDLAAVIRAINGL